MARKSVDVTATEGRDKGKTYRITEMPAWQAEEWALRVLSNASRAGIPLPPEALGADNMLIVAAYGIQAITAANFGDMKALLDEMMDCVLFVPDPLDPNVVRRMRPDGEDTEEVFTRAWLRDQIIKLHSGFSPVEVLLNLAASTKAAMNQPDT